MKLIRTNHLITSKNLKISPIKLTNCQNSDAKDVDNREIQITYHHVSSCNMRIVKKVSLKIIKHVF